IVAATLPPEIVIDPPTRDRSVATPDESAGALVSVLMVSPVPRATPFMTLLPMLFAAVKSPAVVSCQTAVAMAAAVGALPPVGALASAAVVKTLVPAVKAL